MKLKKILKENEELQKDIAEVRSITILNIFILFLFAERQENRFAEKTSGNEKGNCRKRSKRSRKTRKRQRFGCGSKWNLQVCKRVPT